MSFYYPMGARSNVGRCEVDPFPGLPVDANAYMTTKEMLFAVWAVKSFTVFIDMESQQGNSKWDVSQSLKFHSGIYPDDQPKDRLRPTPMDDLEQWGSANLMISNRQSAQGFYRGHKVGAVPISGNYNLWICGAGYGSHPWELFSCQAALSISTSSHVTYLGIQGAHNSPSYCMAHKVIHSPSGLALPIWISARNAGPNPPNPPNPPWPTEVITPIPNGVEVSFDYDSNPPRYWRYKMRLTITDVELF